MDAYMFGIEGLSRSIYKNLSIHRNPDLIWRNSWSGFLCNFILAVKPRLHEDSPFSQYSWRFNNFFKRFYIDIYLHFWLKLSFKFSSEISESAGVPISKTQQSGRLSQPSFYKFPSQETDRTLSHHLNAVKMLCAHGPDHKCGRVAHWQRAAAVTQLEYLKN